MKSTLVSLLIATLAAPAWSLAPADDPSVALVDTNHRCNWKHVDDAIKATDMAKIKKELGDAAIEGSAGEERIKVPTTGENMGDAAGNPLCNHEVWRLVIAYKSQDGKPFHSSKKGLAAVKEQLSVLKSIGDEFVALDKAIEKVVKEAKQVLTLGDSLKVAKVDKTKNKTKTEKRGPGVLELKVADRAEYTSDLVADFKKDKGTPGDAGKRLVLALIAEKQPEDVKIINVGVRVEELQKALFELRAATKKFGEAVSSDLLAKLGDLSKAGKIDSGALPFSEVKAELDLLAKGLKVWSTDVPTGETGAFGHIDPKARDRISIYGNSALALVEATAKAYIGRGADVPGDPAAPPVVDKPKPVVDADAAGARIEKFRNMFESKVAEEIGGGDAKKGAGMLAAVEGKAERRGDVIQYTVMKDGKKTIIKEVPISDIPAEDAKVEGVAAAKGKEVAALLIEDKTLQAKLTAATAAATSPVVPEGSKLWNSLVAGGATGLKSETPTCGSDKLTAEDQKNRFARDNREKSVARTKKRLAVEAAYDKALADADTAFAKCAVFPEGDPRGAAGSSIMDAKLISDADKQKHPTVVACLKAKNKAIADANATLAAEMAKKDVGTEEMQVADDEVSDKKAEAGAALALKAHIINRVGVLRQDWTASPDKAKPYAKGYESEITTSRIAAYFATTWPKGDAADKVTIAKPMEPTAAEVASLKRPEKYEASLGTCIGSDFGVRIGGDDDVEKCVGGLFGRYIDALATAAAGGASADPGAGGGAVGGDDYKARLKKCLNEGGKMVDGKCVK